MFTPLFWKKVGLSFVRAFVPTLIGGLLVVWGDIGSADWSAAGAAALALGTAAVTAGIRAAQAAFTTLETPPQ